MYRYKRLLKWSLLALIIMISVYLLSQSRQLNSNTMELHVEKKDNLIKKIAIDPEEKSFSMTDHDHNMYDDKSSRNCESEIKDIRCVFNDKKSISDCLAYKGNPYVPFSLVKDKCEISGELIDGVLHWKHSSIHLKEIALPYSPYGAYLFFKDYKVEYRDRVLFISADEGVPISNQWDKRGYFYPIQIAQFGLSHYSKYIIEKKQNQASNNAFINLLTPHKWTVSTDASLTTLDDKSLQFSSNSNNALQLSLKLKIRKEDIGAAPKTLPKRILVVRGKWSPGTTLTVICSWGLLSSVELNYVCGTPRQGKSKRHLVHVNQDHTVITYYMNSCANGDQGKVTLIRDIYVDLVKSFQKKNKKSRNEVKYWQLREIQSIKLKGTGQLSSMYLCQSAHIDQFLSAANWLAQYQDDKGGYPVPVPRVFKGYRALEPGWYSAMAQGHAISVLVRAYNHTGDRRYLDAAANALNPFMKSSQQGGVTTHFLNDKSLPWYEEYPTDPPLFVLNGFIYSLIGLYDLSRVSSSESSRSAFKLYKSGLATLHRILPLFDSGTGSFYDLRHFTGAIKGFDGPNRARWEYHGIHIEQLQFLAHVDPHSSLWNDTAKRWTSYMLGYRSPHN